MHMDVVSEKPNLDQCGQHGNFLGKKGKKITGKNMAQKDNEISASGGVCGVSSPGQDMVDMRKASTSAKPNISAKNVAIPRAAG